MQEEFYHVEKLLDIQMNQKQIIVFAKWKGYKNDENTWEPVINLHPSSAIKTLEELRPKFKESKSKQILIDKAVEFWEKKIWQKKEKKAQAV